MRYETIGSLQIPKIGFGTCQIGRQQTADPACHEHSRLALRSALEVGCAHFDPAEGYAAGDHQSDVV